MTKFTDLPTHLIISCLARVPIIHYRRLSFTSEAIGSLLTSSELFAARSIERPEEHLVYCCIADRNRVPTWFSLCKKKQGNVESTRSCLATVRRWFCLCKKPESSMFSLAPVLHDMYALPRTFLGLGRSIYMLSEESGKADYMGSNTLNILDCSGHEWRESEAMVHTRNQTAVLLRLGNELCVLGGTTNESLNPEVYFTKTRQWKSLPEPELDQDAIIVHMNSTPAGNIEIWSLSNAGATRSICSPETWIWENANSGMGPSPLGSHTVVLEDLVIRITGERMVYYDKATTFWGTVRGFGEFDRKPLQAISYGNNMLAWWNDREEHLWCAEIAFERRGDEVYGKQLWKDLVKKEEKGSLFLGSTMVSI